MKNLIFLITSFTFYVANAQSTSPFIMEDWEKARALAKETGKPLVVDFYTEWCGWCKVMDRKTFSDSSVQQQIGRDYIALKLDAEKGIGPLVAIKYRVQGFPTFGFFSSDGHFVGKSSGYKTIEEFSRILDSMKIFNQIDKNSFPGISCNLDIGIPSFQFEKPKSKKKRKERSEQITTWLSNEKDIYSERYFSMFTKYYRSVEPSQVQKFIANKQEYIGLFGEDEVYTTLGYLIDNEFYLALEKKDDKEFKKVIEMAPAYVQSYQLSRKISHYELYFFLKTKEYKKLTLSMNEAIDKGFIRGEAINMYAWDMYLHCEDQDCLNQALQWMEFAKEDGTEYLLIDTYAALAYKTNNFELAETYALKAIEVGEKEGEDVKATEELLEMIKKDKG